MESEEKELQAVQFCEDCEDSLKAQMEGGSRRGACGLEISESMYLGVQQYRLMVRLSPRSLTTS